MHSEAMLPSAERKDNLLVLLAILLSALFAVLPLLRHGCSCGHDLSFHLQNWMEVAAQWHSGVLWPRWAMHAAWNAGEPRFLFYPPLSWLTGAALTLLLPVSAAPIAYTWFALALSGLAMQRLAAAFVPSHAATLAGCLYLANPYMLFVSYERTAYGELLAAAWMPLLLLALLQRHISTWRIALPVALLWITNAPAAVVGCYSILTLGILRLGLDAYRGVRLPHLLRFALRTSAGTGLGLAMAAFYIVPAVSERHFVQASMALVESLQPENNFLFAHTGIDLHDQVLRSASWDAVDLLSALVVCAGIFAFLRKRETDQITTRQTPLRAGASISHGTAVVLLSANAAVVTFLLLRVSAPVWKHAPELAFLQFPWRFLTVIAPSAALLIAFVLPRIRLPLAAVLGLACALGGGALGAHGYGQACDDADKASTQASAFNRGSGIEPTDEYTPGAADNDELQEHDPELWLARQTDDPAPPHRSASKAYLLNRTPQNVSMRIDPQPLPSILVVRLRSFPGWQVRDNGRSTPTLPERNDGLFAIPLTPGVVHTITIGYHWTPDQWLGLAIACAALAVFAALIARERRGRAPGLHGADSRVSSEIVHEADL